MESDLPSKGLEWTNIFLGAALACAAILFADQPAAAWIAGVSGVLIMCCAAAALYSYGVWAEWSNLALGSWVMAAPFVLGYGSAPAFMWTHFVAGLCVASIASLQLSASRIPRAPSGSESIPGE